MISTEKRKVFRDRTVLFVVCPFEHVLVLVDTDEDDDERKHPVVQHVVDAHPLCPFDKSGNTVPHYAVQNRMANEQIRNVIKTYSSIV